MKKIYFKFNKGAEYLGTVSQHLREDFLTMLLINHVYSEADCVDMEILLIDNGDGIDGTEELLNPRLNILTKGNPLHMKEIQRPDSTTVVDEIRFHVIKNKEELFNITERSDKNSLFGYKNGINENTFQPTFWFMIKDKDTDIKSWEVWGNYIVTLELIIEAGLQNYFENITCGFTTAMIKGLS